MDLKSSEPHYTCNDDKHPKNALHRRVKRSSPAAGQNLLAQLNLYKHYRV